MMDHNTLTTYIEEPLRCPQCGQEQMIPRYSVINVTEKPECKEMILKNQIFTFNCSNCHLMAPVTSDCIYIDRKKKMLIAMTPDENEVFMESLASWKEQDGYSRRIVNNINDLKEKILIADSLYDDRIVEICKVMMLKQLESEMQDDNLLNILFDHSGAEPCFLVFFEKKGIGRIPLSPEFYRGMEQTWQGRLKGARTKEFERVDMTWAGNLVMRRN